MNSLSQDNAPPWVVEAVYATNSVPRFRDNRLIEALPDFLAYPTQTIQNGLSSMPEPLVGKWTRKQKAMWLVDATSSLFVAEGRHLKLFDVIDLMIRTGYFRRNPDRPENAKYQSEAYQRQQSGEKFLPKYGNKRSGPITVAVIGCSGTGKSFATEEILDRYPKVIRHPGSSTQDPFDQVVYLTTECPPDGSVKSLCKSIIGEMDYATGIDYSSLYRTRRTTEADLKKAVAHILAMHRVGILVIDEMQNIVLSRKNKEELFNFIVSLANSLEAPVLYVGTPKVRSFMQKGFRVARRFATWGTYTWLPLKFGNGEWDRFYEKLSKLYVMKNPFDSEAIENALFDLSQGIAGIMVNLFSLAQMQAMVENQKTLTVETLRETDAMYFSHVHPMVDALRRNDKEAIARYEDISYTPDDFKSASTELENKLAEVEDTPEEVNIPEQPNDKSSVADADCGLVCDEESEDFKVAAKDAGLEV